MKNMNNTISSVIENGLCTGCGTCVSLCPNESISMILDRKKGVYIFQSDKEKCTDCGVCHKVCSGHEVDFKALNLQMFGKVPENELIGNYLNCYVGYTNDNDIRYNSSSGGLVTSVLIYALEKGIINGALVTRMKKDKPLEPEPFIARTKEEIIDSSKSKYCPVPVNIILKEVINAKDGDKFAVVGLPCHINGLRKAQNMNLKLKNRVVLCVGIFCAHTDNFLATEFILNKFGVDTKDVKRIEYRGRGWPGSMLVELNNGDTKIIPFEKYIKIFHSYNFFTPKRCLLCNDATCELADIAFGDAWNLPNIENIKNSEIGLSILVNRTKFGEDILQNMEKERKIKLTDVPPKDVVMSQRGLIYTKKIGFWSRINILRLVGKKLPSFIECSPKNDFILFDSILPYINTYVCTNKYILIFIKYIPDKILNCYGSISNGMAFLWLKIWIYKQKGD